MLQGVGQNHEENKRGGPDGEEQLLGLGTVTSLVILFRLFQIWKP